MAAIAVATPIATISHTNNFNEDPLINPERRIAQRQDKIIDGMFS
jgi:hypothetical protein